MKIKLLIASSDMDWAENLSAVLSDKYAASFEVGICTSAEYLRELLSVNQYDAAILEHSFIRGADIKSIQMPFVLIDETGAAPEGGYKQIRKYQRISSIAGNILESYAALGKSFGTAQDKAHITAVWSPAGGAGKTAVALAFAAHKVLNAKQAVYLSLEDFPATHAYFPNNGKSISKVFEKLDSNVRMFLLGIRQQDSDSGIFYFCAPENYDDMNILTADDIKTLIDAAAAETNELVIDLPSRCDERVQKVFDLADTVFIVCGPSAASQIKLSQFINQHSVFGRIREKAVLVNNKGAKTTEPAINKTIHLPLLQTSEHISVFKSLSGANF